MSRWEWLFAQLTKRLWVRATLIGGLGILAAVLAAVVDKYIPWELPSIIGAKAVDDLLSIIASSMLAVTTFSLSIMVSAYASATSNVTPRATTLLIEDRLTQTALSTFIGSFLFGIVGLIVLKMGAYGDQGRVVLFAFTIVIIGLVVISLLRWIDHLTRLGRVVETTKRVEEATCKAIATRLQAPYLGGYPKATRTEIPEAAVAVKADKVGYVQHIDMPALSKACAAYDATVIVAALPGTFAFAHSDLAWVFLSKQSQHDGRAVLAAMCAAFSIGEVRSFEQDPRFGLAVMSEIACRALSPALNDAGTAIDVIGRLTRLLTLWASDDQEPEDLKHPRICVPPLDTADLFEDAFMPLARDGAGIIEVQLRLQKALVALGGIGDEMFRAAAKEQATLALNRAIRALPLEEERDRVRIIYKRAWECR